MACGFIYSNCLLNIKQESGGHSRIVPRSSVLMPMICEPLQLGAYNIGKGQVTNIITILIMKANEIHCFPYLFDKVLHMFRTCSLSIIRSISTLYMLRSIYEFGFWPKKQPQRVLEKRKQPRNEISRRGCFVTATTRSGECTNATKRTLRRGRRKKQPQRVEKSKNSQIAM